MGFAVIEGRADYSSYTTKTAAIEVKQEIVGQSNKFTFITEDNNFVWPGFVSGPCLIGGAKEYQ